MRKLLAVTLIISSLLIISSSSFADESPKLRSIDQLKTERLAAQRGTVGQFIAEDMLGDQKGRLLTTYEKYTRHQSNLT